MKFYRCATAHMHNHRAAPSDAQHKSMDHRLTDRKGVKVKTRKLVQKKNTDRSGNKKKEKKKLQVLKKGFNSMLRFQSQQ